MKVNNFYILKVFKKSKLLFAFVIIFIFFQAYFAHNKEYTFPWFTWEMYSKVEYLPDTMTQRELYINGERLDVTQLPIWQEAVILHTFHMYNWQKINDYNDPMNELVKKRTRYLPSKIQSMVAYKINNQKEETITYPNWISNYLAKITGKNIETIEYKEVRYKYDKQQNKFYFIDSWNFQKFEE